jgi:hypothetical protein
MTNLWLSSIIVSAILATPVVVLNAQMKLPPMHIAPPLSFPTHVDKNPVLVPLPQVLPASSVPVSAPATDSQSKTNDPTKAGGDDNKKQNQASGFDDPAVMAAYKEWLIATFKRQGDQLIERKQIIFITNGISYFICAVAHILLALAAGAAFVEFRRAAAKRQQADNATNEMKLSLEGIALKTSLHGVILLSLAIAFYFLYLRFVYGVAEVGGQIVPLS